MRLAVRHKWFEHFLQHRGRHADAGIADVDQNLVLDLFDRQRQDPTARHRFARIFDQVAQHSGEARQPVFVG